jgi:hypothetical protein
MGEPRFSLILVKRLTNVMRLLAGRTGKQPQAAKPMTATHARALIWINRPFQEVCKQQRYVTASPSPAMRDHRAEGALSHV